MSVKKYVISKTSSNYTIIQNKVLQNCNDYEALGLYCYMFSLPPSFEFHLETIAQHAGIGRDKIRRLIKKLSAFGLIKVAQMRDAQNRFAHYEIQVDNGDNFKQINDMTPETDFPATENQLLGNSSYKRNNKKEINKKRNIKSLCATDVAQTHSSTSFFNQFWQAYPRKKDRLRALKIWQRKKLDAKFEEIMSDLRTRTVDDTSWQDPLFVPYAKSYLEGEIWNDPIEKFKKKSSGNDSFSEYMRLNPPEEVPNDGYRNDPSRPF